MNLYFEITDCMVSEFDHKYLVKHEAVKNVYYIKLTHAAERIWCEDGIEVTFLKHRYLPMETKVDMAEFMWVKLKSQSVHGKF